MSTRIGVDIGGTFTDLIFFDDRDARFRAAKVPTTPNTPEAGCLTAVETGVSADELEDARYFMHGTTVGLNAVLEMKGATLGLIATEGFRDVLEIRRGDREAMYDPFWMPRSPMVPRHLRLGVRERITAGGEVFTPLDEDDVVAAYEVFQGAGVRAVAVALINAYANHRHESRIEALLRELGFDGEISLSHKISGEYREFERTCTTVVDAFIKTRMKRYLGNLSDGLSTRRFAGDILITRSGSGSMTLAEARRRPFETLMSGPVAGAEGAAYLARRHGLGDLVTADVGGTSFDTCLVRDGRPQLLHEGHLAGMPIQSQWVDVRSIGAGGGSVAYVDAGGLLQVGPQSAGATPGPVCYDRGGRQPTVTDAACYLGMYGDGRLSGDLHLRKDLAEQSIESLAGQLNLSPVDAARGVLTIATFSMADEIREITLEQGIDPRELSLLAFGGGGPLLATLIAQELGIGRIVVPPYAGNFSAWGMLVSDVVRAKSRTVIRALDKSGIAEINEVVEALATELNAQMESSARTAELSQELSLDMRYRGQEHSLTVELPAEHSRAIGLPPGELRALFDRAYAQSYGLLMEEDVEIFAVRITLRQPVPGLAEVGSGRDMDGAARRPAYAEVCAYSFDNRSYVDFRQLELTDLSPDTPIAGPAVIKDSTTTIYLDDAHRARRDAASGCLFITRED